MGMEFLIVTIVLALGACLSLMFRDTHTSA